MSIMMFGIHTSYWLEGCIPRGCIFPTKSYNGPKEITTCCLSRAVAAWKKKVLNSQVFSEIVSLNMCIITLKLPLGNNVHFQTIFVAVRG